MSPGTIKFRLVPEVRYNERRAVGFLEGHGELNAGAVFESLDTQQRNFLRVSIDLWVDGANGPATRFHGFPNDKDYWMCFTFKAKESRQHHRFYGYLDNPQPVLNRRFQVCVLCVHAMKSEHETDRSELERVRVWYASGGGKQAVQTVFPDGKEEKGQQKGRVLKWKRK